METDFTDRRQVLEWFLSKPNPDKNGKLKQERFFALKFQELYSEIQNFLFDSDLCDKPFAQRLWHFLNNDSGNLGRCPVCGKRTKFQSFTLGYLTYCSNKCANRCDEKKAKSNDTWKEKYGGVGYQSEEIGGRARKTMLDRYGVEYTSQNDVLKKKVLDTERKNFGGVGIASETIRKKFNKSMVERYGVEWSAQSDTVTDKKRAKKIEQSGNIIAIDDDTFTMSCLDSECNGCKERSFEINKKTYAARISRGNTLCTKTNPPKTAGKGTSDSEQSLYRFVTSVYEGKVVQNDRDALGGMELDIYLPDIGLGIEFNGDYWHLNPMIYTDGDTVFGKSAESVWSRIMEKEYAANKAGITVMQVWESEWTNDTEIVMERVANAISNPSFKPSPYFLLKDWLQTLQKPFSEERFGVFDFGTLQVIFKNCFYSNKNTVKSHLPQKQDVRTVYVYDFEVTDGRKFSILKSLIRHALGMTVDRIYARNCSLRVISNKEAKPFLEENSLFGNRSAKVTLGLFHNNELVMVYSFGHNFYGRKDHIEVIRVCTRKDTVVVGGSSKCLKYFIDKFSDMIGDRKIIFYVDRIHNDGNSLSGFKFIRHEYGVMNYWVSDYVGDGFVGVAGTAFNRMPSKHKEIKKLAKLAKIVPFETLGVDVYEYVGKSQA